MIDWTNLSMSEWRCDYDGCGSRAFAAGLGLALAFIGWGFNEPEKKIFCPAHHPQGPEQVELQVRATMLFMKIAQRLDHASPNYDPGLLLDLHKMAGEAVGDGVVGVLLKEN